MSTKLANRVLTDQLVEELLEAYEADRWEYIVEVQERLGWTAARMTREVTYLQHRYDLFRIMSASGCVKLTAAGLERYLAGERLEATCNCCLGENER